MVNDQKTNNGYMNYFDRCSNCVNFESYYLDDYDSYCYCSLFNELQEGPCNEFEKTIDDVKQSKNIHYNDYRATVGGLRKILESLDDDLNIGVAFDGGFGYTDIHKVSFIVEKKLVILNCD